MAWTSPMTFASNAVLTAAQLNVHLRDNLNETAPAKATSAGGYFVTHSLNTIVERVGQRDTISAEQTTTSTSYTDLTTAGPTVTVSTGGLALVIFGCQMHNTTSGNASRMSVEVSGATTNAASDIRALTFSSGALDRLQASHAVFYDDLTPGSNVFTAKYRVEGGTGHFNRRRLIVLPY